MAVSGRLGKVTLSRDFPPPVLLAGSRLIGSRFTPDVETRIDLSWPEYETGAEVVLVTKFGVPADLNSDGYPDAPGALGALATDPYTLGPTASTKAMMNRMLLPSGTSRVYDEADLVGETLSMRAFVNRDAIGDIRFYETEIDAINGGANGLIQLYPIGIGTFLIAPASDAEGYVDALREYLLSQPEPPAGEKVATGLPGSVLTTLEQHADSSWKIQCSLDRWVLENDSEQLDQGALGEAFGEYVAGRITGSGEFAGEVDHVYSADEYDALHLMRLHLLARQGRKASARFTLLDRRGRPAVTASGQKIPKLVSYEADLLLGRLNVDCSSGSIIRFRSQFVVTGEIKITTQLAS